MLRVIEKPYRRWSIEEKTELRQCGKEQLPIIAERMGLKFTTVDAMWRHLHDALDSDIAVFDYSKIAPLKALFVRCPVCGGTTTVNKNAYCRSCLSQWHPITLEPLTSVVNNQPVRLHDADPWS